jgi:hypothetical protein
MFCFCLSGDREEAGLELLLLVFGVSGGEKEKRWVRRRASHDASRKSGPAIPPLHLIED